MTDLLLTLKSAIPLISPLLALIARWPMGRAQLSPVSAAPTSVINVHGSPGAVINLAFYLPDVGPRAPSPGAPRTARAVDLRNETAQAGGGNWETPPIGRTP